MYLSKRRENAYESMVCLSKVRTNAYEWNCMRENVHEIRNLREIIPSNESECSLNMRTNAYGENKCTCWKWIDVYEYFYWKWERMNMNESASFLKKIKR